MTEGTKKRMVQWVIGRAAIFKSVLYCTPKSVAIGVIPFSRLGR